MNVVWLRTALLFCIVVCCPLTIQAQAPAPASASTDLPAEHAAQMAKGLQLFQQQVGPILTGRCVKCHGGESTESDFDLTSREKLLAGGASGPVLAIGQGKDSRFYRVMAHLEEPAMPEDGARLSATDLAAIATWLELGAPYDKRLAGADTDPTAWTRRTIEDVRRDFWSFRPLQRAQPPQLPSDNWSQTPIDHFVLNAARKHDVSPNPLADRRTLIRRAYLDLLGLPPPAEAVEAFRKDPDPDAYAKLIDRLLDSPHYGERWGRHWLDVARFAESHGFEQDYDRPYAYHYRDFVIRALNADMPYDQFVRWQLAGDELAPHDPLALAATGFLGAGVFPTQLTEKEFEPARYDELDDMVATTGTAFLGLTIGCARCHDHKFDPIPAADYYRLAATFATTIRSEIELDLESNTEPFRQRLQAFETEHQLLVDALRDYESNPLAANVDRFLSDPQQWPPTEGHWHVLNLVTFRSAQGATLQQRDDGSILVSGPNPSEDQYHFVAETNLRRITGLRVDALTHPSLPQQGPGRAPNGNFALSDLKITAQPLDQPGKQPVPVKLANARATHEQNAGSLSVKSSIDDHPQSGWAVDGGGIGHDQSAVFDFAEPLDFAGGVRLTIEMRFATNTQHSLGRPRLSLTTSSPPAPLDGSLVDQQFADGVQQLRAGTPEQLTKPQREAIRRYVADHDPRWQALKKGVADHAAKRPQPTLTKMMVSSEGLSPIKHHADGRGFPHFYPEVYYLRRGDAQQKQGPATAGYLQVLMNAPDGERHWQIARPADSRLSFRRTALASWMTDTQYGAGTLLARVMVNRLWHHHFGRGIVATPNDFGYQGARPSHPELLDWLAAELIANGWRLKPIHKLIMSSAVYMQSSTYDEADAKLDPENAWCWRLVPRRLEAETIRDSLLAVSGELDRRPFGPGTLHEGMKRRSIYFMVKRSKLIPMLQLFDAPEPLVGVGDRPSTTIAPQSLLFLNNPLVRDSARSLARRIAPREDALAEALDSGYRTALARPPTDVELDRGIQFLRQQIASYRADGQSDAVNLAFADFCQALFGLNEFIYLD